MIRTILRNILTVCIIASTLFGFFFGADIKTSAENFEIPTKACELSKSYPTIVTDVDPNNALSKGLYMVNCQVIYVFPTVTAMPAQYSPEGFNLYTPIGQYTIDFGAVRRQTELNNKALGYEKLKTPFWMPYSKDYSTGDDGDYAGWNLFGLHGAPWRAEAQFYGNAPLYKNGTHGCSNMRTVDAEAIYNEIMYYKSIGQKVKVYNY